MNDGMNELTTDHNPIESRHRKQEAEARRREMESYRKDFPILQRQTANGSELAFLDNAASSQRPLSVIQAMTDCYERYYANVHRGIHTLSEESTESYELAREKIARFIHAKSSREIIFTAGTTAAINTVARSWGDSQVAEGDVILVTIADHHANIVPWHQLAQRCGCRVVFVPIDEAFTITDEVFQQHLENLRPKLVAFPATSNVLGTNFPARRWTTMARQAGATTLVDAAQSAPHARMDVQAIGADFVVFSGHKMCGPTGIGVLYGRESILEIMPPFLGGGGMIHRVTTQGFESAELPDKFEAGTPPIVEAIGLAAAADYLETVGLDRVAAHEQHLGRLADDGLRSIEGIRIIGPAADKKAGITSFHIDGVHAHDIAQQLDTHGIAVRAGHHCTMPLHQALGLTSTTRASFYLYNTEQEVERLVQSVQQLRTKFAPSGRRRKKRE